MTDHDNITVQVRINEASVEHVADIAELLGQLGYTEKPKRFVKTLK